MKELGSNRYNFLKLSFGHLEFLVLSFVIDGDEFESVVQKGLALFLFLLVFSQVGNMVDCFVGLD